MGNSVGFQTQPNSLDAFIRRIKGEGADSSARVGPPASNVVYRVFELSTDCRDLEVACLERGEKGDNFKLPYLDSASCYLIVEVGAAS